jgi:hypothetical protein
MPALSIHIFLDESSDEKQDVVYVVAGFVGAEENWAGFSGDWSAVVAAHGLAGVTFHMTEFESGTAAPWKSLKADKQRRESLLNALLGVIEKHKLCAFGAMLLVSEYNAFTGHSWDHPYKLALETALFSAVELCAVAPGGKIRFTCDQNNEVAKWVLEAFEKVKQNNPGCAEVFGHLEFSSDDASPELCAADMLAFEMRKHVYNSVTNSGVPMRYPMKKLSEGLYQFWKVDFSHVIDPKDVYSRVKSPVQ